jgi:hypothetical protein
MCYAKALPLGQAVLPDFSGCTGNRREGTAKKLQLEADFTDVYSSWLCGSCGPRGIGEAGRVTEKIASFSEESDPGVKQ